MKAEIKRQWVAALRSGAYIQRQYRLKPKSDGKDYYCCLGVLCDITKEISGGKWDKDGYFSRRPFEESMVVIPNFVGKLFGLEGNPIIKLPLDHPLMMDSRIKGKIAEPQNGVKLAELNDLGFSFAEIADLIEKFIPED